MLSRKTAQKTPSKRKWTKVLFSTSVPDDSVSVDMATSEQTDRAEDACLNSADKNVDIQADIITAKSKSDAGVDVPARYILTTLGFLACFTMYCLRTCLNVAIVAMVNSTALAEDVNSSDVSTACPGDVESSNVTTDSVEGEFVWDEKTQGTLLGAFYYGYTVPSLFAGWLADRYRGKRLMGVGLLLSSLLVLAMPYAAYVGPSFLIAVRVLQGVMESSSYSAMQVLCTEWMPVHERSKLVAFAFSGSEMGTMCGMLMTGLLSRYGFAGGWPSAFYVFGTLGCVWCVLWALLVYDSPAQHPRISDRERRYIQSSVGERDKVTAPTPWREILTSPPVWAVSIGLFVYNWGFYSMFTSFPTYMKQILHFEIVANGFLSSLPYLLMFFTQVLAGIVSDHLRRYVTTVSTRKLMFTIGSVFPAVFLVAAVFVDCDPTLAVLLMTIGVSAKGFAIVAVLVSPLDFAPKFAGTVFGIVNCFASVPGFLAPAVIGELTYQNQTVAQWRKFFIITAAVYAAGILTFVCFGRGELQPWAAPAPTSTSIPTPLLQNQKGTGGETTAAAVSVSDC